MPSALNSIHSHFISDWVELISCYLLRVLFLATIVLDACVAIYSVFFRSLVVSKTELLKFSCTYCCRFLRFIHVFLFRIFIHKFHLKLMATKNVFDFPFFLYLSFFLSDKINARVTNNASSPLYHHVLTFFRLPHVGLTVIKFTLWTHMYAHMLHSCTLGMCEFHNTQHSQIQIISLVDWILHLLYLVNIYSNRFDTSVSYRKEKQKFRSVFLPLSSSSPCLHLYYTLL